MVLCTVLSFFTLYSVSGLGCSTNACHVALWLVASCCIALCCAALCCAVHGCHGLGCSTIGMAASTVPSSIMSRYALFLIPFSSSLERKVAKPLLKPRFSVGPRFLIFQLFLSLFFLTYLQQCFVFMAPCLSLFLPCGRCIWPS